MQNYICIHFGIKFRLQLYIILAITKLLISGAVPPVFRMTSWSGA